MTGLWYFTSAIYNSTRGFTMTNVERWTKKGIIDNVIFNLEAFIPSNDKDDLGGKTGAGGITLKLLERYKHLWAKHGFDGDYLNVPYSLTYEIYVIEFWNKMYLDDISKVSPQVADLMMNWAINSGNSRPVTALQRLITLSNNKGTRYPDIKPDGVMGKNSITGLNNYLTALKGRQPIRRIMMTLVAEQWTFYSSISESREDNEKFLLGWQNRLFHALDDIQEKK